MTAYAEDAAGRRHDITEAVQIMYDTVVASLDFGSGFLDVIEVARMREAAELLGFAPMEYAEDLCSACGHQRCVHSYDFAGRTGCRMDSGTCDCTLTRSEIIPISAEALIEAADGENSTNEPWLDSRP